MQAMKRKWSLFLIVAAIFLIEICNELPTTGMFLDGIIYGNLAANLTQGIGTFWSPMTSPSADSPFVGHPPLAFGLLALCYKTFGVHIWVTKCYSLLMVAASGLLILRLWRQVGMKQGTGWLPLLFWILVPLVSQYACDNMLENTMAVFLLAAVACMLHSPTKQAALIGWHLLAGGLLYLAFLTKGVTGLYPLCFPLAIWVSDMVFLPKHNRRSFPLSLSLCLITAASLSLCIIVVGLIQPASLDYLEAYIATQVISGSKAVTVSNRWYIIIKFFERTAVVWGLVATILCIYRKRLHRTNQQPIPKAHKRTSTTFFLLTVSGVIPMVLSTKQSDFYIITVFPYFAIAAAALLTDTVEQWIAKRGTKFQRAMTGIALALSGCAIIMNTANYGKPGRDHTLQQDIKIIAQHLDRGEIVAMPHCMRNQYSLINYAYRSKQIDLIPIDLDKSKPTLPRHLLTDGSTPIDNTLYQELPAPTCQLKLYELVMSSETQQSEADSIHPDHH